MKLGVCRHCGATLMQGAFGCLGCGRLVDEHDLTEHTSGFSNQTQLGTKVRDALLDQRWRLVQPLGRGKRATTWLAHDVPFDRRVVVKLLDESYAQNTEVIDRFELNARRLASIEHRNVVAVLALGRHQGLPFVAMRQAEGHSLAEHLHAQGGRLQPAEAAFIVSQLAEAFEAVHQRGGPQGGLQPRSIFVSDEARVTLLDVRVAKEPTSDFSDPTTRVTERLEWVASEVLAGGEPTVRSDGFTLGCVAWELLMGAPPSRGTLEELLTRRSGAVPPLPAEVPEALRAAIARATHPDAAQRFATASELAQALAALASQYLPPKRPVVAPPEAMLDIVVGEELTSESTRPGDEEPTQYAADLPIQARPLAGALPRLMPSSSRTALDREPRGALSGSRSALEPPPRLIAPGERNGPSGARVALDGVAPRTEGKSGQRSALDGVAPRTEGKSGQRAALDGVAPRTEGKSGQRAALDGVAPRTEGKSGQRLALGTATKSGSRQALSPSEAAAAKSGARPAVVLDGVAAKSGPRAALPETTEPTGLPLRDATVASADLRALLPPDSEAPTRLKSDPRRRRAAVTVAAAVLVTLVGLYVWVAWEPARVEPPAPVPMQRVAVKGGLDTVPAPAPEPARSPTLDTVTATETIQDRKLNFDKAFTDEPGKGKGRSKATARFKPIYAPYFGMEKYGELQVVVLYNGKEASADISIDGELIGPSPIFRPLKPGTHIISLERRPLEPVRVPAQVPEGKTVRMEIELVPLE
ncbi:MAG: protein kinase [Archangiaceae bacterium]|nr:protein kinase [Archangiaceae bacterium]